MITAALLCAFLAIPAKAEPRGKAVGGDYMLEKQRADKTSGAMEHCLMSKDATGRPRPAVVVKKDRIEVLNENGGVKVRLPKETNPAEKVETHVYPDRHGKVVGVQVTRGYSQQREGWTSGEYYILDSKGNRTLNLREFNVNTRPIPSPSGDYAVGWPGADTPGGPPIFYDANGVRNKWAHGFKGDGWPEMYETHEVRFSPEGRHVAVLAKNGDLGKYTMMIVYDSNGNKLFEKKDVDRDVVFSSDSLKLAYYSTLKGKVGLVNIQGSAAWEKDIKALPRLFSSDGRFLLVMTGNFLGMIRADNGNLIWKWEANVENLRGRSTPRSPNMEDGFWLASLAATPDFDRIIMTASTLKRESLKPAGWHLVSEKDHILIFNRKGHLIHWETLPGESFQIPSTMLQVSDDGQHVAVALKDGIAHFTLKHK